MTGGEAREESEDMEEREWEYVKRLSDARDKLPALSCALLLPLLLPLLLITLELLLDSIPEGVVWDGDVFIACT